MSSHEMQGHSSDHSSVGEGHDHPSPKVYIQIAVILAIITALEVFVLYLPSLGLRGAKPFLLPIFAILSVVKFVLVVGWYMHLKFDSRVFLQMFGFALLIALMVATIFIALFHGLYFL